LGPLVTELPVPEYFRAAMTWSYYKNLSLYLMQYDLPGVFRHNPYAQPVNGSLWTLMYEFTFYLLLLVLSLVGGLKNKWLPVLAFAAALSLRIYFYFYPYYFDTWYPIGITNLNVKFTLDFGLYFLAGTVLTFFRKQIPFTAWTLAGALIPYGILLTTPLAQFASYLALPIIILSIAFAPQLKFLNGAGMFGDFSYGMYIYAFPIQQSLVFFGMKYLGGAIPLGWMVLLSIMLTLPFAVLSWHFVEKPFLKLKRKTRP
jgi:peptidoglycan/LPS O-acetylase OafA/YrhL